MAATVELTDYYARRAGEYERIYAKPERQADLTVLRSRIPALLKDRRVYEVACGTGYWTQFVATQAAAIFATDYNEEVLAIAREKALPERRVQFAQADAFKLPPPPLSCDAGFAGFWWSHLRRENELGEFLRGFCAMLEPGARMVFLDNAYVEGSSTPLSREDEFGNTYQSRKLQDGASHEVLKNFPDEAEVRRQLALVADDVHWERLDYYWLAWAEVR